MVGSDTIEDSILKQFMQKLESCIQHGELDACVEEAAQLAGEVEIDALELLGLAWDMANAEKYEFAYVLALGAVDGLGSSEDATGYFYAGVAAQYLGNVRKAEIHYLKTIEADPNHALAHYNYAFLLNTLGRKSESEFHYLKAIEANPKLAAAHNDYANLLNELSRKSESEFHYLKAIEVDPKLAAAHNNYALLLRERGKFFEAEKEVMRAFQIAQDDSSSQEILPYAHGTLGDIHADEDDYGYAEKEYQKALEKSDSMDNSSISEIHNNLGWVYTKMGKFDKAENEFKKACGLDPMNIKAKRNLRVLARRMHERIAYDMSVIQIFIGSMLLLLLTITYALFFITKISEASFVVQSTIFLLLIFVLFDIISKFKFDKNGLEVERSMTGMYVSPNASMANAK